MKTTILISFFAFIFGNAHSQTSSQNQPTISEFKVYGECGMCKTRIEKAAKVDGVTSAIWDKETKILKVEFLPSKVKVENIHKNIAKAGHDTEKVKADDATYNKLPECCKYERSVDHQGHKH